MNIPALVPALSSFIPDGALAAGRAFRVPTFSRVVPCSFDASILQSTARLKSVL